MSPAAAAVVSPVATAAAVAAGLVSGRRLSISLPLSLQEPFQRRLHLSSNNQQLPPLLRVFFRVTRILPDRPSQLPPPGVAAATALAAPVAVISPGLT